MTRCVACFSPIGLCLSVQSNRKDVRHEETGKEACQKEEEQLYGSEREGDIGTAFKSVYRKSMSIEATVSRGFLMFSDQCAYKVSDLGI